MSTKISALTERLQSDINGEEFFPIIDVDTSTNNEFHTYKIKLDTLFASDLGYEKVTDLQLTANSNTSFTLTYTKEDNTTDVITVPKYFLEDGHVAFSHINSAGYITSDQKISNNLLDTKLVTPKAVDEHHTYREGIYDAAIKAYYGDHTTDRTGSHVLSHFRLNSEVADDFVQLADGVSTELDTLGKIETKFNTIQPIIDSKIGIDQVNPSHFRVGTNLFSRLNIRDAAIGSNLIGAGAVVEAKLGVHAVTNRKLGPISVSADKIQDDAIINRTIQNGSITPDKLSEGHPEWNTMFVSTPSHLLVGGNLTVDNDIIMKGHDFRMYNSSRAAGNVHPGRALVHYNYDTLHVNYAGDFTGGTVINGKTTVPHNTQSAILAGGSDMVATKGYVDYADIRIRPLDPSRVQDDCIQLRHMSDDSVSTAEIVDRSITPIKLSNGAPSWNTEGQLTIGENIRSGRDLHLGYTAPIIGVEGSNIWLYPAKNARDGDPSRRATATRIHRYAGDKSVLEISNPDAISFKILGSEKLRISKGSDVSRLNSALRINGHYSTIAGTNHSKPLLQLGDSTVGNCLSMDTNEIVTKGDNIYLTADTDKSVYLRSGTSNSAVLSPSRIELNRNLFLSHSILKNTNNSSLIIAGGISDISGASIRLYGSRSSRNARTAAYSAYRHDFKTHPGASASALSIDTRTSYVTLPKSGTSPLHLVNKAYVDQQVFKSIIQQDDITSRINSGFYQTSSASTQNGWPETTNSWYHLLTTTHSNTSNYHALQFAAPYYDQEVYFRVTNNQGNMSWKKVWHSDNVGPGSGLNADLLDGKHANAFSLTGHNHDTLYRKKSVKITPSDLNDYAPSWDSKETILQGNVKLAPASDNTNSNFLATRNIVGAPYSDDPTHAFGGEKLRSLSLGCGHESESGDLGPANLWFMGSDVAYSDFAGAMIAQARLMTFSTSPDGNYYNSHQRLRIDEDGLITAPNLTKAQISGNIKALVTKEYIDTEIAKVFPDERYLRTDITSKQIVKGLTRFEGSDTIATTIANIDNKGCLSVKLGTQYMGIDPNEIAINTNILHITTDGVGDVQINRKKVWGDHNTDNIIEAKHIKTGVITHGKLSTGAPSWTTSGHVTTSGDVNITGSLKIGPAGNNTRLSSTRVGTLDTLNIYSDDKIHFKLGSSNLLSLHNNGAVTIGTTSTVTSQGKVHIDATAVPLSFRETDRTGKGSYWRMPLDGSSLRFDSSNDGVSFSKYTNVFQMYSDGRIRAHDLTIARINSMGARSLVTKEYVDNKVASITPVKSYHVDLTNTLLVSANDNDTYFKPNTAVRSAAMAILPNLESGDRVSVSWGYKINASGNGSGTFYASQVSVYTVVNATTWNLLQDGSATRMS